MMVNDARIFIILGGFHLFECSSEEMSNDGRCISQEDDTPSSVGSERPFGLLQVIHHADQSGIQGLGESDWLAKSLVLLQTS